MKKKKKIFEKKLCDENLKKRQTKKKLLFLSLFLFCKISIFTLAEFLFDVDFSKETRKGKKKKISSVF